MNISTPDSYLEDQSLPKKPGRPKGSGTGKKVKEQLVPKRPVGRPRRDGLPPGSLNIRPNLQLVMEIEDDWKKLSKNEPEEFLSSLILALSSLPPPASAGPTAEEAFRSHLNSLGAPPVTQRNHNLPTLYSILKTFWLPTSPAYFSLTASASTRTLSDHRFFYWDPQPLVINGISCPSCSSSLHNEGRIKHGPLKIYDVERPFFVIGAEYVCKNDGKRFASTDPSILSALPSKLRDELPLKLLQADKDLGCDGKEWCWKAAGVSKTLWNLVIGCLRAGLTKDVIVKLLKDTQSGVEQETLESFADGEPYTSVWAANPAPAPATEKEMPRPVVIQQETPSSFQTNGNQQQTASSMPAPTTYSPYAEPSSTNDSDYFRSRTSAYDYPPPDQLPFTGSFSPQIHSHSCSSLDGAVAENTVVSRRHSPQQMPTQSVTTSSPSSTVTSVLTHAANTPVPVPTTSSSSIMESSPPASSYSQVQQPIPITLPSSNLLTTTVYDYPMADYSVQDQGHSQSQTMQIQHSHSQSQPPMQMQMGNSYPQAQLAHTSLAGALPPGHAAVDPMALSMTMMDSPHSILAQHHNQSAGPNSSTLHISTNGVSLLHHITEQITANSSPMAPTATSPIAAINVVAPAPTPPLVSAGSSPDSPMITTPPPTDAILTSEANAFFTAPQGRPRNPRHCPKCGLSSCKGKGGRTYCTNTCKDCGRFECRGRNSRRPDKNCVDGWG